jgi:hypothetical protein
MKKLIGLLLAMLFVVANAPVVFADDVAAPAVDAAEDGEDEGDDEEDEAEAEAEAEPAK